MQAPPGLQDPDLANSSPSVELAASKPATCAGYQVRTPNPIPSKFTGTGPPNDAATKQKLSSTPRHQIEITICAACECRLCRTLTRHYLLPVSASNPVPLCANISIPPPRVPPRESTRHPSSPPNFIRGAKPRPN